MSVSSHGDERRSLEQVGLALALRRRRTEKIALLMKQRLPSSKVITVFAPSAAAPQPSRLK